MNIWERFYHENIENNATQQALIICDHYQMSKRGYMRTKCSEHCPFRESGGGCKIFSDNGILKVDKKIKEIIEETENV